MGWATSGSPAKRVERNPSGRRNFPWASAGVSGRSPGFWLSVTPSGSPRSCGSAPTVARTTAASVAIISIQNASGTREGSGD